MHSTFDDTALMRSSKMTSVLPECAIHPSSSGISSSLVLYQLLSISQLIASAMPLDSVGDWDMAS